MNTKINYKILNPGGNKTALVIGNEYSLEERRKINKNILDKNPDVEQVGFISTKDYKLEMAGGEFCVNATRCAIFEYLKGKPGTLDLYVSGAREKISGGITQERKVFANMQINKTMNELIEKKDNFNLIKLDGILQAVLDEENSKPYIKALKENQEITKLQLKDIMKTFDTTENAVGIILLEKEGSKLKIYPVIWVKTIDTLYYQTACGSGSLATAIYKNSIDSTDNLEVVQPSGYSINVQLNKENDFVKDAIILGEVIED